MADAGASVPEVVVNIPSESNVNEDVREASPWWLYVVLAIGLYFLWDEE